MASGSAVATTQNRRKGTSVRVVSQATGTAMATDEPVTATANVRVLPRSSRTRALDVISQTRSHPTSAARTTR